MSVERSNIDEALEAQDQKDFEAQYAHLKNLTPEIRERLWKQFRMRKNRQRDDEALQARMSQKKLQPLAENTAAAREELADAVEKWKKVK